MAETMVTQHPQPVGCQREPPVQTPATRRPAHIATLDEGQLTALRNAASQAPADRLVDFRASTRWFKQRYYVRVLIGHEKRNMTRLRQENQISVGKTILMVLLVGWLTTTTFLLFGLTALYLIKSALGIDLFEGPSFMHQFFFSDWAGWKVRPAARDAFWSTLVQNKLPTDKTDALTEKIGSGLKDAVERHVEQAVSKQSFGDKGAGAKLDR
jgi:hypothetical protein